MIPFLSSKSCTCTQDLHHCINWKPFTVFVPYTVITDLKCQPSSEQDIVRRELWLAPQPVCASIMSLVELRENQYHNVRDTGSGKNLRTTWRSEYMQGCDAVEIKWTQISIITSNMYNTLRKENSTTFSCMIALAHVQCCTLVSI